MEIYKVCTGILVASKGEGFGLSLIEGAAYHKPLLVRDIPVFREIAGEYASYFSGMDTSSLVVAIKNWLSSINDSTAPDSANIRALTWQECTDGILHILNLKKEI